jgi:hypothetical protein
MNKVKPILITGSHRSGSTWAGKILSTAPNTAYIHEPFNIAIKGGVVYSPFEHWFKCIIDDDSKEYKNVFSEVLQYKYPLFRNVFNAKSIREIVKPFKYKFLSLLYAGRKNRPIVKDPIAFFSAQWLSHTFDMNVLVMIRHPAAFCSSLKIKNWYFDFNNFLEQPILLETYLKDFESEIRDFAENEKSIIEQAILLWNCIHHTIIQYQKLHPEWLFVKHEDLSNEPIEKFQEIFEEFNLDFSDKVKLEILKSSGVHNPTEQQLGNEFVRNSRASVHNWKNRLKSSEIEVIKSKTSKIALSFYSDNEW